MTTDTENLKIKSKAVSLELGRIALESSNRWKIIHIFACQQQTDTEP